MILTDAQIIKEYAGIRDQDGFETLELTLIEDLGKVQAARAMKVLSKKHSDAEELEFPHHTREEQDEYDHHGEEFETNADVE